MNERDRILVACVGNIFLGDDGFGVEVAQHLARQPMPTGVQLADIGIRGIHLAYELLDGCELLVLVDAAPHGQPPGTVSVIEVGPDTVAPPRPVIDAHGLAPDDVFTLLEQLDARPTRTIVVACEPADVTPGMDLTPAVAAAIPHAVRAVEELLRAETAGREPEERVHHAREWSA
jgi:hydrogenase maturation protease